MAIKKTTKGEGKLEVLRGEEAVVLNDHFAKTGKYGLSEFSDEEKASFEADLLRAREKDTTETRGIEAGDTE